MKKLLVLLLLCLVFGILAYETCVIYQNFPREPEELKIEKLGLDIEKNIELPVGISYLSENLRFNHNLITYYIFPDCSLDRKEKMEEALSILSKETEILSFINGDEDSDILISCSEIQIPKEENVFIAGEGGPSKYINNTIYPIILKGRIFLYNNADCESALVEMHELLHVFGFNHSTDKTDLMYPTSDCKQELKKAYIIALKKIYSIKPLSDLYFKETESITKAGVYLGFEITIINRGILDATNASLCVYADNKKIDSFSLGSIKIGEGQKFSIQNIKLPSRNIKEILLKIESQNEEYYYENNVLKASI